MLSLMIEVRTVIRSTFPNRDSFGRCRLRGSSHIARCGRIGVLNEIFWITDGVEQTPESFRQRTESCVACSSAAAVGDRHAAEPVAGIKAYVKASQPNPAHIESRQSLMVGCASDDSGFAAMDPGRPAGNSRSKACPCLAAGEFVGKSQETTRPIRVGLSRGVDPSAKVFSALGMQTMLDARTISLCHRSPSWSAIPDLRSNVGDLVHVPPFRSAPARRGPGRTCQEIANFWIKELM